MRPIAFAAFVLGATNACELTCDSCDWHLDEWDFDGYEHCLVEECTCAPDAAKALTAVSKRTLAVVKDQLWWFWNDEEVVDETATPAPKQAMWWWDDEEAATSEATVAAAKKALWWWDSEEETAAPIDKQAMWWFFGDDEEVPADQAQAVEAARRQALWWFWGEEETVDETAVPATKQALWWWSRVFGSDDEDTTEAADDTTTKATLQNWN